VIDHLELYVTDLDRSTRFYAHTLAPLGYARHASQPSHGFGTTAERLDFWIRAGVASQPPPHFAFTCATRGQVAEAHAAAVAAGGTDAGAPAVYTRIAPDYFAAFVVDPDGHKVEFVHRVA
jgi:catechol 2,3-dioxygenase-like lactoylglutathione lyase family enzyme